MDAVVSMLSIQLFEHTYDPGMEIFIAEVLSLNEYMSQVRHSLCLAHNYLNPTMSQVWKPLYPNYRDQVDICVTDKALY